MLAKSSFRLRTLQRVNQGNNFRMFSALLLKPLNTGPNLPSEFTNGFNLTDKLIQEREEEYEVFN